LADQDVRRDIATMIPELYDAMKAGAEDASAGSAAVAVADHLVS
jgi:hypothetical protein